VELLEGIQLLPRCRKGDRFTDDLLHRERGTTACITVQLGEDHAVDRQRGVERLGHRDGILACHCVDDEKRVARLHGMADLANLLHHLFVDGETPGGVDDQHVATDTSGLFEAETRGLHRVARCAEDGHADLCAEHLQLLDGGRSLQVGTDQHRLAALLLKPRRQLGRTRGLARTLQTSHEHHGGRLAGVGDLQCLTPEQGDQFGVDDLHHLLCGVECLRHHLANRLLADAPQHVAHDRNVDVGLQQSGANLAEDFVDVGFAQATAVAQFADDGAETIAQRLEHAKAKSIGGGDGRPTRRWAGATRRRARRRTAVGRTRRDLRPFRRAPPT